MAQTFENSNKRQNLKGLMANPKSRTIIIVMGALVFFMILVGFLSRGGQQAPAAGDSGTESIQAPSVEGSPGTVQDARYQDAVEQQNAQRLEQAQQNQTTVLPTLTGPTEVVPLDPLAATPTEEIVVPQPQVVTVAPVQEMPQPQQAVQQVEAAPAMTEQDVTSTKRYQSIEQQVNGYLQSFGAPTAFQEFAYNGVDPRQNQQGGEAPATGINGGAPAAGAIASMGQGNMAGGAGNGASDSSSRPSASLVRAGTIVPAVLLTSLRSDAPGPVLAQIVSGPLAGARVLGTFQATEKEIVVQFQTLSKPGEASSFRIDAYAVNSNLGTGLATNVDNHYFRRYGLLLASGFLQGYGQAIGRSGTTTTVTDGGGVIITQDELNSGQIARVALGQAGSTVAADIQSASDVDPTVYVDAQKGGGLAIGLLFMNDF